MNKMGMGMNQMMDFQQMNMMNNNMNNMGMNQMMDFQQMNMMNNNMSGMGMSQIMNFQEKNSTNKTNDYIEIQLRFQDDSRSRNRSILININDKVKKILDICQIDPYAILIYNAKKLNFENTIAESGIKNNSIIFCIINKDIKGGEVGSASKSIADPTKKAPIEWETTTEGPFYLTVKNGINIFGLCQNKDCEAYKKEVCSPFGYGTFDLIKDLNSKSKKCPKCPACEFLILELESCGFMNCKYSYIGRKYENGKLVDVNFSKKTKKTSKSLEYIDPGKKGENKSMWVELKISADYL